LLLPPVVLEIGNNCMSWTFRLGLTLNPHPLKGAKGAAPKRLLDSLVFEAVGEKADPSPRTHRGVRDDNLRAGRRTTLVASALFVIVCRASFLRRFSFSTLWHFLVLMQRGARMLGLAW
jgi:hypothetical protein